MSETAPEVVAGQSSADADQTAASTTATTETDWQAKLEAQKKVNQDLERKLKASLPKEEAEQLRADLAKLQGKEAEYAEQLKQREVEQAAVAKANERILKAEIRAAAAGKLADPSDALVHIDLSKFEVGADGEVDASAIEAAIKSLLESKPYLAAQGGQTVITSPTLGRDGALTEGQLTKADVERMTKAKDFAGIEKARQEGRLNSVLGIS